MRKNTKQVMVGNVAVGGGAPIAVQTMTKTKTWDAEATIAQIKRCKIAGADIVRSTVNDEKSADAMKEIVSECRNIPIVADIHFNHIFALKAIEAGVAKVRINPGNIGSEDRVREVLDAAKNKNIPIRIGVNSGSLDPELLAKYGHPTAEALYASAMKHVEIANKCGFDDLIISVKSTSVPLMIAAYRMLSERCDYPLHLGVTEAGTYHVGTVKSAIGIGTLLSEGIGDTIRVSLTEQPEAEVAEGERILQILGLKPTKIEIVSCPTCGRTEVDLMSIVKQVEKAVENIDKSLKVAIMGCVVNGPGEAKEADLGVACGKDSAVLFCRGEQIRKISGEEIVENILAEIEKF